MLAIPQQSHIYRLLSIDPGTDTLGICVSDIDLVRNTMTVVKADTFAASRALVHESHYELMEDRYHSRYARLMAHSETIMAILSNWGIHGVACESPFMHMRAQAFQALSECIQVLQNTTWRFDHSVSFDLIAPMQAKAAVKASGKGKNKLDVKDAIFKILSTQGTDLFYNASTPFEFIDEHTVDAIAVGYCQFIQNKEMISKYC